MIYNSCNPYKLFQYINISKTSFFLTFFFVVLISLLYVAIFNKTKKLANIDEIEAKLFLLDSNSSNWIFLGIAYFFLINCYTIYLIGAWKNLKADFNLLLQKIRTFDLIDAFKKHISGSSFFLFNICILDKGKKRWYNFFISATQFFLDFS